MTELWIIVIFIFASMMLCFTACWRLGGNYREQMMRLKGFEDANAENEKMVEKFNHIDSAVDAAGAKLGGLRKATNRDGEVPKARGT